MLEKTRQKIGKLLKEGDAGAWVLYQFLDMNPIIDKVAGTHVVATRRAFLVIPQHGEPRLLHSSVDENLEELGIKTVVYTSYEEFKEKLKLLLSPYKKVAMEFSPFSEIPHISKVDAGVVDLVRSYGIEVITSGDLMQLIGQLSDEEVASHIQAAKLLDKVRERVFEYIKEELEKGNELDEYSIQQFILSEIKRRNLETVYEPDAVINENGARTHYTPSKKASKKLEKGDLLLIDLWLKVKQANGIYADITWMVYRGDQAPEKIENAFRVVVTARDRAIDFLREKVQDHQPVEGWEVDKVARDYIEDQGLGQYFTHRLGHSIGTFIHGDMTHLDNYENRDTRKILSNHITSVEPGIYIPGEFGIRCEVNVVVKDGDVIVTTVPQTEIYCINV